ncbi:MAG: alpha/beta hydrolase [Christensenellales bacterium]
MKEKRSVSSAIIESAIRLSGVKKRNQSKEKAKKEIKKAMKKNSKPYKFPKLFRMKAEIVKCNCDGMDYYVINKKENEKNVILYMHGGCYVNQPLYFHWKFIEQLAINTEYTIYVPIYPKAPNCTYIECYEKVLKLYLDIIDDSVDYKEMENVLYNLRHKRNKRNKIKNSNNANIKLDAKNEQVNCDNNSISTNIQLNNCENNSEKQVETMQVEKNITFMGDSAGGGFILAFAQYLRNSGIRKNADNIIMLSPWLDMSLENPDVKAMEDIDPSLATEGIVEMAKTWAGGSTFDNYMLSPIKGTFENLGKMTIFIGTHEILLPDARELKEKLTNQNIDFNYYEYPYMNHVFPLFPIIPEAKSAKKTIYKILNDSKID